MDKKLPIYKIDINEFDSESGVDFISLVDEPAMELNWLKFNKEVKLEFKADTDKKLLYGVFITPDKMIYRNDPKIGEYYTFFTKDSIQKIVKKFNKNNFNRNINFMHGDNVVNGYVVENFITSDMIKANLGFEVVDGSWIGSVYIEDDKFWNDYIKTGVLQGFSVEIVSKLIRMDMNKAQKVDELYDALTYIDFDNPSINEIYDRLEKLFKD